jgi:hypothetical protein
LVAGTGFEPATSGFAPKPRFRRTSPPLTCPEHISQLRWPQVWATYGEWDDYDELNPHLPGGSLFPSGSITSKQQICGQKRFAPAGTRLSGSHSTSEKTLPSSITTTLRVGSQPNQHSARRPLTHTAPVYAAFTAGQKAKASSKTIQPARSHRSDAQLRSLFQPQTMLSVSPCIRPTSE